MAKTTRRLLLPPALGAFTYIWEPRPPDPKDGPDKKPKYGITLLWKKENGKAPAALLELQTAIVETARSAFGQDKEGKPVDVVQKLKAKTLHNPFYDGDVEKPEDKTFAGHVYINASSEAQPGIVDAKVQRIISREEAYAGCTFRATVAIYSFEAKGNKGVAIGLNNLQVVAKGPRMDGRKSAEEDFGSFKEQEPAPAAGADSLL